MSIYTLIWLWVGSVLLYAFWVAWRFRIRPLLALGFSTGICLCLLGVFWLVFSNLTNIQAFREKSFYSFGLYGFLMVIIFEIGEAILRARKRG